MKKDSEEFSNCNDAYRNGGDIKENEAAHRDLIDEMAHRHNRHDILANDLRWMGVTESGDDPAD